MKQSRSHAYGSNSCSPKQRLAKNHALLRLLPQSLHHTAPSRILPRVARVRRAPFLHQDFEARSSFRRLRVQRCPALPTWCWRCRAPPRGKSAQTHNGTFSCVICIPDLLIWLELLELFHNSHRPQKSRPLQAPSRHVGGGSCVWHWRSWYGNYHLICKCAFAHCPRISIFHALVYIPARPIFNHGIPLSPTADMCIDRSCETPIVLSAVPRYLLPHKCARLIRPQRCSQSRERHPSPLAKQVEWPSIGMTMAQEHRSHVTADSAQRQATALRDEEVKELARLKEEIASLRAQVQAIRATAPGTQSSANGRARRASNADQNIDATSNDIKRLKTEHALLRARLRAMRSALGKASTDDGSTVKQGREEPMSEPPPTSLNAEVQQMKSELLTLRMEAVSWRPFASEILLKYLDDVEFKKNKKRVDRTSEVKSQAAHTDNYCADSGTSVASTRHKACPTSEQLAPRPQRAERVDCDRLTKEIAWLKAEIGLARSVQSSRLGIRQGHDERVDQPISGHLQDTAQEAQSSAIQPHNVSCDKNSEIATRPGDKVRYVKRKRSGVPLEKDAEEKKRKRSESFFLRALHHTSMQSGASGSFGRAFASPMTAASASGRAGH